MRIGQWLESARERGVARLDAQRLLAFHLGRSRTWVLAHDDEELHAESRRRLDEDLGRRADDVPLAYLVGVREFHGLALQVSPGVLVPRPETEALVDWALELATGGAANPPLRTLADLGTGSGAIALAFKHAARDFEVVATDASAAALAIARANGERLGLAVDWRLGDWWAPLAGQRFALVVSNPPYIAAGDPHLHALRHEPAQALTSGPDGLSALKAIVAGAGTHLVAGGWLLVEHGFDQGPAVRALLIEAGFERVATRPDLAGQPRTSGGQWPGVATCQLLPTLPY